MFTEAWLQGQDNKILNGFGRTFQPLDDCHCWWTSESPRAHVAKFYGRLRLIRSVLRASKFSVLELNGTVILWVYYAILYGFTLFRHFWISLFNFLNYFVWLLSIDVNPFSHFLELLFLGIEEYKVISIFPKTIIILVIIASPQRLFIIPYYCNKMILDLNFHPLYIISFCMTLCNQKVCSAPPTRFELEIGMVRRSCWCYFKTTYPKIESW